MILELRVICPLNLYFYCAEDKTHGNRQTVHVREHWTPLFIFFILELCHKPQKLSQEWSQSGSSSFSLYLPSQLLSHRHLPLQRRQPPLRPLWRTPQRPRAAQPLHQWLLKQQVTHCTNTNSFWKGIFMSQSHIKHVSKALLTLSVIQKKARLTNMVNGLLCHWQ